MINIHSLFHLAFDDTVCEMEPLILFLTVDHCSITATENGIVTAWKILELPIGILLLIKRRCAHLTTQSISRMRVCVTNFEWRLVKWHSSV